MTNFFKWNTATSIWAAIKFITNVWTLIVMFARWTLFISETLFGTNTLTIVTTNISSITFASWFTNCTAWWWTASWLRTLIAFKNFYSVWLKEYESYYMTHFQKLIAFLSDRTPVIGPDWSQPPFPWLIVGQQKSSIQCDPHSFQCSWSPHCPCGHSSTGRHFELPYQGSPDRTVVKDSVTSTVIDKRSDDPFLCDQHIVHIHLYIGIP